MFKKKSNNNNTTDDFSGGKYWKDVLHEIYLVAPVEYSAGKVGWTDNHPIAKKLDISGEQLHLAVEFLKKNGLVQIYMVNEADTLNLSKKGFEVALQNEKIAKEEKSQKIILFFTFVLAISSAFTFFASLDILYNNFFHQNILAGGFCVSLIIAYYYMFHFSKDNKVIIV